MRTVDFNQEIEDHLTLRSPSRHTEKRKQIAQFYPLTFNTVNMFFHTCWISKNSYMNLYYFMKPKTCGNLFQTTIAL